MLHDNRALESYSNSLREKEKKKRLKRTNDCLGTEI